MATTAAVPRTANAEQPAPGPGVYSSRMLREAIEALSAHEVGPEALAEARQLARELRRRLARFAVGHRGELRRLYTDRARTAYAIEPP